MLKIDPIQIIVTIFVLFTISRAYLRVRDSEITTREFIFWVLVWLAVIVIAYIPDITSSLSKYAGVGRGIDMIVYISIVLLYYLVFRIYVKIEKMDQGVTEVIRQIAFKETEKKRPLKVRKATNKKRSKK